MTLADAIRNARNKHRISLTELASDTVIDAAYLSRLERGQRVNPRWQVIRKLRDVLSLELDEVNV